MEKAANETWTRKQVENQRTRKDKLMCKACVGEGKTTKAADAFECAACHESKTRSSFNGEDLKNQQKKKKTGSVYTLVCLPCNDREKRLKTKLDQLDARLCHRSCGTQLFRHADGCKAKYKLRLSVNDLQFMSFRTVNKTKYHLQDVAYYERLGVLMPEKRA
jgi:hypothetical protein